LVLKRGGIINVLGAASEESFRPCLGTQFFQTAVFQIQKYTLVMTLLQFTIVGVSRPGVPKPTSECRCVPQPRWVEREAEREGGKRGGRSWA
jgi:hypothetical protein